MPYKPSHRKETREKIVESARIHFNRKGFEGASIDEIMQSIDLTRGGFYNHFKNKEELFAEAVQSFLMGRGAKWREEFGINIETPNPQLARKMIEAYLSPEHLGDLEGQCPMIALPSDVARSGSTTQNAFEDLLNSMIWLLTASAESGEFTSEEARRNALTSIAMCVGGMVLARTLPNSSLAEELRKTALNHITSLYSFGKA